MMAIPGGLEPPTRRLEGGCSIQLSYGTVAPFWPTTPCQARRYSAFVMNTLFGSSQYPSNGGQSTNPALA